MSLLFTTVITGHSSLVLLLWLFQIHFWQHTLPQCVDHYVSGVSDQQDQIHFLIGI